MRGRKPEPTRLKILRGNPGKRALNAGEPDVPLASALPAPPEHLGEDARLEWLRVGPELLAAGLVTALDTSALAGYCSAYGRWVEAERSIKKHGVLVKSPSGFPMQSPYLAIANKALEQMTKLLTEFGMSPSSRSRVTAAAPGKARAQTFGGLRRGA